MQKAVFFDFDGTLTYKSPSVWKTIWAELGYDVGENSEYRRQFNMFLNGDITYQEWCDLTFKCFYQKNMNLDTLNKVAESVKLIRGVNETLKTLKEKGYSLHLISGNIVYVIKKALRENVEFFDSINANEFCFDNNKKLIKIKGTNYDYVGKANFIKQYKDLRKVSAKNLYFVGNGNNDVWVYLSGCNTICINPDNDKAGNEEVWHKTIDKTNDLRDILQYIK